MNFFRQALKRSTAILFASLFLGMVGAFIFTRMPRSLFPEIDYPRVIVEVNMGFAPLQNMEWGITSILERELRAVPGVRLVKSSTSRGTSSIDIFLREGEDVTQSVQRVNAKIAELRAMIPPNAQISVRPISASAFPGAEYCFVSKTKNSRDLRTFVEYSLKPQVLVQPGIFNVWAIGGDLPEFRLDLNPKKMAVHNLTAADISDRLKNSNGVDFLGPVERNGSELLAFGGKYLKTISDIESVVVDSSLGRPVRVSDIGHVELTNAWKYKQLSLRGDECVALDVFYQNGINQNLTSHAVFRAIDEALKSQRDDITYRYWDLNDFTDRATNAVLIDLLAGMFIIALVTFSFLRSPVYSLYALLIMPLAATVTFLGMSALHLTLNLMTLGGLTAAIGLVVDNTVIVLEMFAHKWREETEASITETLVRVLTTVTKPMIFGTAAIVLVFMPIGFLSGISGMFFLPMALVNALALIISVFVALLVVPALVFSFRNKISFKHDHEFKPAKKYAGFLHSMLVKPRWLGVALVLLPLAGLVALHWAKTGFLPEWDEGDIVIDYRSETPVGLATTVQKLKPLEEYLNTVPEVDFFIRKTGTSLGELNKSPYVGEIIVRLKQKRNKDVFQLRTELGDKAEKLVPGFEFDLFQILPDRLNDLSGSGKPIVLYLRGQDPDQMDAAAKIYRKKLAGIPGLESVRVEEPPKAPEIQYEIDESLSRILDMNPTAISENARFALFTLDTSEVQRGPQTIPIRLKLMQPNDAESLADVPIYSNRGGLEKLGQIGKVKVVQSRVKANHIDGNPVRTVTAEIVGRDLGSVVKDIQEVLGKTHVDNIFPELAGEYRSQQSSFRELLIAFFTGLFLIFITSLFYTNYLRFSAMITLSSMIPPGVGLVSCVLMGIALDVSSFTGLISVTGIAVANSFMAFSAIQTAAYGNLPTLNAVKEGMSSRLRPILMTNIAAMAGFLPIAVGLAAGDEILRPFSLAVIFGLFGAMYSNLVVMPLLYSYVWPRDKES